MRRLSIGMLLVLGMVACQVTDTARVRQRLDPEARPLNLGVDQNGFDYTETAAEDFYHYVNGQWLKRTEIPGDKSNYGSFTVLADEAEANIRTIIEQAGGGSTKKIGSNEQRIGDMYSSFMDADTIESLGSTPLEGDLKRIDSLASVEDVTAYIGYSQTQQLGSPIVFYVNQDAKNPTDYIAYMHHGGLSLPDRDYYIQTNERFNNIREKFQAHIEEVFSIAGMGGCAEKAKQVIMLETQLAEKHWSRVKNRDRDATYNKFSITDANATAPGLDWNIFLTAAKIGEVDHIILRQPDYYMALGRLLDDVGLEAWRNYLRWKLLSGASPFLSQAFVDANFNFFSNTLTGVERQQPRWKRGVQLVNDTLGELVGELYVQNHFDEASKTRMDELVENLRQAFRAAIDELDWMGDRTKSQAQAKLLKFATKIGYPDEWKDYSALEVRSDDLIGNLRRSNAVEYARQIDKLDRRVDRGEWFMTPQTVNAYYNPSMNEIVFPAAILQPPFFNIEADDAVNYGAIGAVIGHEFSHGFDDQGRKSDGDGKLTDWWTDDDAAEFRMRANGLVAQYDQYVPMEGKHVNGELTLGENIGDLAGLTMAYKAYQLSLNGTQAPVIEGFTGNQRFFLGWAQVWRRKYRDDELIRRLTTDTHSPSHYRVIGVLSNMPEFYQAFDVKEGDAMYIPPEDRVKIW